MDIYLSWDNDDKQMLLPINPTSFEISGQQNNQSVYVHNLGELNLKGKRSLYSITIDSFFPAKKYDFRHGKYHEPYDYYCKKLKQLYQKNETLHLIITGTDINMYCTIESFSHGESDGSGDVSYKLDLKEYRTIDAAKRVNTKKKEAIHTWKKGNTWSKVVKKYLGSSETWKSVRKTNADVIKKAKRKNPGKKEAEALIGYKVTIK